MVARSLDRARDEQVLAAIKTARRCIFNQHLAQRGGVLAEDLCSVAAVRIAEIAATSWRPNVGPLWSYCRKAVAEALEDFIAEQRELDTNRQAFAEALTNAEPPDLDLAIDAKRELERNPQVFFADEHLEGWSTGQLAKAKGVSARWIRRLIADGTLYGVLRGGKLVIPDALAVDFLSRRDT